MTQQMDRPPQASRPAELSDSAWQSHVARPVLIAIQVTCLVYGLLLIAQIITENPLLRYTLFFSFIAGLVGVYSAQWLAQPTQRLTSKTTFMVAELVVILAILRILTWWFARDWPTLDDVQVWLVSPWRFFDGFFLASALVCALAWHRAHVIGGIFYWLALTPGELAMERMRLMPDWRFGRATDRVSVSRQELVESYVSQWLVGALFVAFCAAVTRVRVTEGAGMSLFATGIPPQIIIACVFYFLIGLILTSQARLAMLRGQWLQDGVEMPERLPGRWHRFSLLIILAIGLLAMLLPIGSTWQIGEILGLIVGFFVQLVLLIIFAINLLFVLIMSLFGSPQPLPRLPVTEAPRTPPPVPPTLSIPDWLGGAGLWILVLVIVLLSLRFLLGKEGIDLTVRTLRRAAARIKAILQAWWDDLRGLARTIQAGLPAIFRSESRPEQETRQSWRFIRVGGLSPRDKVRYFYLSTVRRAADRGVIRRPSQTPSEFVRDLEATWPEADLDMEALTEAFVTARYDASEISPTQASGVQQIWERVKRTLRRRNTPPAGEGPKP